jgi:hypothetical protein
MDRVQKILASAPKLRRDSLIPTSPPPKIAQGAASKVAPAPVSEDGKIRRKAPEELKAELFPVRLQVPVTKRQNLLLTRIAQELQLNRAGKGEAINKNTIARCVINLLEGVEITEVDKVSSEQDVEELLRRKLAIR